MKVIEEQQNKWKSVNIYIIIITFLYNFFGEKQYMELFPLALIINIRIFFSCLPDIQKKEEEFILQRNETNKSKLSKKLCLPCDKEIYSEYNFLDLAQKRSSNSVWSGVSFFS